MQTNDELSRAPAVQLYEGKSLKLSLMTRVFGSKNFQLVLGESRTERGATTPRSENRAFYFMAPSLRTRTPPGLQWVAGIKKTSHIKKP